MSKYKTKSGADIITNQDVSLLIEDPRVTIQPQDKKEVERLDNTTGKIYLAEANKLATVKYGDVVRLEGSNGYDLDYFVTGVEISSGKQVITIHKDYEIFLGFKDRLDNDVNITFQAGHKPKLYIVPFTNKVLVAKEFSIPDCTRETSTIDLAHGETVNILGDSKFGEITVKVLRNNSSCNEIFRYSFERRLPLCFFYKVAKEVNLFNAMTANNPGVNVQANTQLESDFKFSVNYGQLNIKLVQ